LRRIASLGVEQLNPKFTVTLRPSSHLMAWIYFKLITIACFAEQVGLLTQKPNIHEVPPPLSAENFFVPDVTPLYPWMPRVTMTT